MHAVAIGQASQRIGGAEGGEAEACGGCGCGICAGEFAFGCDGAAVGERGLDGHDGLLFVGVFESLDLLPGVAATVLELVKAAQEFGNLFLQMSFDLMTLGTFGAVLGQVAFFPTGAGRRGGLETGELIGELGGSVLQTFPLLRGG